MTFAAGTFRSFANHNYRIWAVGAIVSNIGTWMQRIAQDWLVLAELTHRNATAVGIVMGLQFGPQILLLPWTGFAADHFNRRKLLMATQAIMGVLSLALGILTITGLVQLWHVYVFASLFGSAAAFDAPARQTFVSELVGDADLPNAVALNSTSFNLARMVGPAVAGILIGAVGSGWAFLINGVSFLAVIVSLNCLRVADLHVTHRASRARGGIAEGFRYVWGRQDLRAILMMSLLIGAFGLNFPIFIATMSTAVFHAGAGAFGLLSSIMAIGTVAGALLAAGRKQPGFANLLAAAVIFSLGCAMAAVAPDYGLFGAALVVIGMSTLTFTNTTLALMQLSTAPAMRGRVMALVIATALGSTAVGAPLIGRIADTFGPRWALAVAAISGLAAALIALRHRISERRQPASAEN